MLGGIVIAVLAMLATVAAYLYSRRESSTPQGAVRLGTLVDDETRRFHAVSIRPGINECEAVRGVQEERYLSAEAPNLPLAGCDSANCQCRFVHHRDRRRGEDRRSPFGGNFGGATGRHLAERRELADRRTEPPDSMLLH